MIEQPQVNIKTLPEKPTVDDLYNYLYNRKERRSHTPAKREEIKRKLWENYRRQLAHMKAMQGGVKDEPETNTQEEG